jgi:hypothetical protein
MAAIGHVGSVRVQCGRCKQERAQEEKERLEPGRDRPFAVEIQTPRPRLVRSIEDVEIELAGEAGRRQRRPDGEYRSEKATWARDDDHAGWVAGVENGALGVGEKSSADRRLPPQT